MYIYPNQVPTADLWLKREYMKVKRLEVFDHAHLGVCAQTAHRVILQDTTYPGQPFYHAQMPMKDSAVIVWPVTKSTCKSGVKEYDYFEPNLQNREIQLVAIWDLSRFKAVKIVWRSWAWQRLNIDRPQTDKMSPAIRAFMDGSPFEFFKFMCTICFGKLSRTVVEQILKAGGVAFSANQTFSSCCSKLSKQRSSSMTVRRSMSLRSEWQHL